MRATTWWVAAAIVLGMACNGGDDSDDTDGGGDIIIDGDPVVTVQGGFYLLVNDEVTLTANTANHDAEGYAWSSSNDAVASVVDGVVKGHAVGMVSITAVGNASGVSGMLGLTVDTTVPYIDEWSGSGHADVFSRAFTNWDGRDEVSASCARCHTTTGYQEYIGADGSDPDLIENAHPTGQTVECTACHNNATSDLSHVLFPSGVVVENLGAEARCMTCHLGRSSGDDIDDMIDGAGVGDDEISDALSFRNIHYLAAAATLEAGKVRGAYQYEGQTYDWRFRHAPGMDTCIGCHDPHTLEVQFEHCAGCHNGVEDIEDVKNIRMMASLAHDYDGDGNLTEGIFFEVDGVRRLLRTAISNYGDAQGTPICYDEAGGSYYNDNTGAGWECDPADINSDNSFDSYTPRLVRSTYNYNVARIDPGNFAHNAKYTIEFLHDSIAHLNEGMDDDVDLSTAVRNDSGHFDGTGDAARHWDDDDEVSASCSRCHGGSDGYRFFVEYGVGNGVEEPDNGLECYTCHEEFQTYSLLPVHAVTYPSGIEVEREGDKNNICRNCHMGRESKSTIDAAIDAGSFRFRNVHYLPSASTKMGTDAQVGYEYDGKTYASEWTGHGGGDGCIDCHNATNTSHTFLPNDNLSQCQICHLDVESVSEIRPQGRRLDYNGDGDSDGPMAQELAGLRHDLYVQMQAVGIAAGNPLCYASSAYPYWFADNTGTAGAECDAADANYGNQYGSWTPGLMKSAHNYQMTLKDPGAWSHNFSYAVQLLVDSVEDMGGDTGNYIRP